MGVKAEPSPDPALNEPDPVRHCCGCPGSGRLGEGLGSSAVPAFLFSGMSAQVHARTELLVVEVGVKMLSLEIVHDPHRGNGARELAECLVNVFGLRSEEFHELVVEGRRCATDSLGVLPRVRSGSVERPSRTELPFGKSLDYFSHRTEVLPGEGLEHSLTTCRIGHDPPFIRIVTEPQAGDLGFTRSTEDRQSVDAVKAPPSQANRAGREVAHLAGGHEFRAGFGQKLALRGTSH